MQKEDVMERFFKFLDRVRGRKDVRSRVDVIANPKNLKTMSILTRSQAEFVAVAHWASDPARDWGDMWKGLKDYSDLLMETSKSVGGKGIDQSIQFVGALNEMKALRKLGVTVAGEPKEGKA